MKREGEDIKSFLGNRHHNRKGFKLLLVKTRPLRFPHTHRGAQGRYNVPAKRLATKFGQWVFQYNMKQNKKRRFTKLYEAIEYQNKWQTKDVEHAPEKKNSASHRDWFRAPKGKRAAPSHHPSFHESSGNKHHEQALGSTKLRVCRKANEWKLCV